MIKPPTRPIEPSIRSVAFASCYVYSPGGVCAVSARSRSLCALVKTAAPEFTAVCVRRVVAQMNATSILATFFDPDDVLVPVPASEPRRAAESPAERLADALVSQGLATRVWTGLSRTRAIPKSAISAPGRRPTVTAHYDSLGVARGASLPDDARLLLVDDVVTRGRTLFAAAIRLHEAFPRARVRAFALVRTLGFVHELERLLDPCVGRIGWRAGDVHRNP